MMAQQPQTENEEE